MDTGILIIRLFFGLDMAGHGARKLLGWFGGHGIKGTGRLFESIGFRPGAALDRIRCSRLSIFSEQPCISC